MLKNTAGKPPSLGIFNHPFRPFRKLQDSVHLVRQSHMPFFMQIQVLFFLKWGFTRIWPTLWMSPRPLSFNKSNIKHTLTSNSSLHKHGTISKKVLHTHCLKDTRLVPDIWKCSHRESSTASTQVSTPIHYGNSEPKLLRASAFSPDKGRVFTITLK